MRYLSINHYETATDDFFGYPEFFCDRETGTTTLLDALHNGRNVMLVASRRMGKTGLIRHAFYRLKEQEPDIVTLYLDIYATQSLGDFVCLFANSVLGKLDPAPKKSLEPHRKVHLQLLTLGAIDCDKLCRAASSVRASLKKLLDNERVYRTACGYIIYDRFMDEWLRSQA